MTLIEFLGFIITMILVIYLSSKRAVEDRKRRLDSNYYGEGDDEDEQFQEMMHLLNLSPREAEALEREVRGKVSPPPAPAKALNIIKQKERKKVSRTLSDQYALHTNIEDYKQRTNIEQRKLNDKIKQRYEVPRKPIISEGLRIDPDIDPFQIKEKKKSRLNTVLDKLDSKKNLVIFHEILDRPKALKDEKIRW